MSTEESKVFHLMLEALQFMAFELDEKKGTLIQGDLSQAKLYINQAIEAAETIPYLIPS